MTPDLASAESLKQDSHGAIIDIAHLDQYTLGDRSLQRELLQLFRIQLKDQTQELMACKSSDDWKSASHTLKGAACAVGAWQIALVGEQLEDAAFDDEAGRAAVLSRLLAAKAGFEAEVVGHI